jgi:hypothetical protein
MKGLFVIHSTNLVYGASKSLAQLLNNVNFEYDLIFPKTLSDNISDEEIREIYGGRVQNIYRVWLPYELCFYGKPKLKVFSKTTLKYIAKQIISKLNRNEINKIMVSGGYDFIYLNSLTLYPLINKKFKTFIHVREVVECSERKFKEIVTQLNKATGVVFIDYSSQHSFKDHVTNELILNNPFNMKKLERINASDIYLKYNIPKDNTIFTILGTVSRMKGIDFIIRSFIKSNQPNTTLIIVGNNKNDYGDKCKELALDKNNIIFIDELNDPSEIYSITDYVLRGESMFTIGRTVYEGLYSGCNVIIQGNKKEDSQNIFEYEKFKDNIFFYTPKNEEKLVSTIKRQSGIKVKKRNYYSNIDKYVETLESYIRSHYHLEGSNE